MSLHEDSLLLISEMYDADSAKFKKIGSLGGRQYRLNYCLEIESLRKYVYNNVLYREHLKLIT